MLSNSLIAYTGNFASCAIVALIDSFFAYNKGDFGKKCRDLTRFITQFQLVKMTILLQSATNLVAKFVKTFSKFLDDYHY